MLLELNKLSKTYGNGVQALKDITLSIPTGMFGLLGPNGAGKSTLMRSIATLQLPDKGSIRFNGIDVLQDPINLRKTLGYLPQDFGVYPNVSAYELLMYVADMKGVSKKTEGKTLVDALLQKVNLYEVRHQNIDAYSGGMKQRFGIAQALIGQPKLIIVDEPTAGLDPIERNRFYNLLAELGKDAVVILSTHIVEDVNTLCNNMAIIGNGNVVMEGEPKKIQAALEGKLWELPISKDSYDTYDKEFNILSSKYNAGNLWITIYSDDQPESKAKSKKSSLEDAYFNVIRD